MGTMKLGHTCQLASGPTRQKSFCRAYRYDAAMGFEPDSAESHVVQFDGTMFYGPMYKNGWLPSLWRSATGLAYVTDHEGILHAVPSHGDLLAMVDDADADVLAAGRKVGA
jgi:hypothetical protein